MSAILQIPFEYMYIFLSCSLLHYDHSFDVISLMFVNTQNTPSWALEPHLNKRGEDKELAKRYKYILNVSTPPQPHLMWNNTWHERITIVLSYCQK